MKGKRNHVHIATILFAMLAVVVPLVGCTQAGEFSQDPAPTGIQILFKLDPRLLGPTYGGARWVSPPTYGPILHPGDSYVVEARARALDQNGQPLPVDLEWKAENPGMVTVSPSQGDVVTINIQGSGESQVLVAAQGVSKTITIKAVSRLNDAIEVEIVQ